MTSRIAILTSDLRRNYRSELAFYQSYHRNTVNWSIHAISIPFEWFSSVLLLTVVHRYFHWAFCMLVAVYYVTLGTRMAVVCALCQLCMAQLASIVAYKLQSSVNAIVFMFAIIQLLSWTLQVWIGHRIFEQNRPAILDKFTYASVLLSPLLAWEILDSKQI